MVFLYVLHSQPYQQCTAQNACELLFLLELAYLDVNGKKVYTSSPCFLLFEIFWLKFNFVFAQCRLK